MYEDISYGTASSSGGAIMGAFMWFVLIALYVYFSYMHYRIAANKTGNGDIAWWAFVPILNTVLLIKMAEKPMWWFLLLFIPIANWIVFIVMWMKVAEICGQSQVWGFLVTIPLLNFIAMFVLAFGGKITYEDEQPQKKHPVSIS